MSEGAHDPGAGAGRQLLSGIATGRIGAPVAPRNAGAEEDEFIDPLCRQLLEVDDLMIGTPASASR